MRGKSNFLLVSILILSLFVILVPAHSVAVEPVRVYVDPPSVVNPPVFFNVSVKADNLENFAGAEWVLRWDPNLLYAINMTEVIFHQVTPQSEWDNIFRLRHIVDNQVGMAEYAYHHQNLQRAEDGGYLPISGNYTIAIILFRIIGMGNCTLHFETSKLATPDALPIAHDTVDGLFSNSVSPPPLPPSSIDSSQVLFRFDPSRVWNESLVANTTFSVAVELDSVAEHGGIIAVNFDLVWNSTILDCTGVEERMFHEVAPKTEWDNINWNAVVGPDPGHLQYESSFFNYSRAQSSGYELIFGNHTLAIVTFTVKNIGQCTLHLSDCFPFENTWFRPQQMLYSTVDGFFLNVIKGDLNCDDAVNLFDAILLAKSFGAFPGCPSWNEATDINGDGLVDIFDAIVLCSCLGHTR